MGIKTKEYKYTMKIGVSIMSVDIMIVKKRIVAEQLPYIVRIVIRK